MASKNKLLGHGTVPESEPVKIVNDRKVHYPCWMCHDTLGTKIFETEEAADIARTQGWYRKSETFASSMKTQLKNDLKGGIKNIFDSME